jgi:predicted site-specific integrase-resolvase
MDLIPNLLNPKQLSATLCVSSVTILSWYHARIIPAEIAEGRIYKFDLEKVRSALAERAQKRQEER